MKRGFPLPTIHGEGFTLRSFAPSDVVSLQRSMNDERVARKVTNIPYPYTLDHARAWIETTRSGVSEDSRRVDFAIDIGGNIVGSVAFINLDGHKAQLSYWLNPEYWGKGIMTSAVQALLAFGFDTMGLVRIYAYVYNENRASARVLTRAGFVYEGTHELEWQKQIDGVTRRFDSNYYSIVRRESPLRFALRVGYDHLRPVANSIKQLIEYGERGATVVSGGDEYEADIAIAVGGDGTMFRSVAEFSPYGIPTIGINGGDVGFLTSGSIEGYEVVIRRLIRGEFQRERRLGLELIHRGERIGPIVNDVVVQRFTEDGVATLSVLGGGVPLYERIKADGVIISTSTGSTAYSLSVGGPVVDPRSRDVEISYLAPMRVDARHFMSSELSSGGEIEVRVDATKSDAPLLLTADSKKFEIVAGESFVIRASPTPLLFATFGTEPYLNALRTKLGFVGK